MTTTQTPVKETRFTCHQCKQEKIHVSDFSTGYGTDKEGNKTCFDCCGINDAKELTELETGEKMYLYFNGQEVTNWPATLRIKPWYTKTGSHNIAGKRIDVWFRYNLMAYHGIQYGDNTQILHVKKLKCRNSD